MTSAKPHVDIGCRPVRLTLLARRGADARHPELAEWKTKDENRKRMGGNVETGMFRKWKIKYEVDDDEIMLARRDFLKEIDFERN